jgi:RNA polymerase sigma factor (sigma-70 family)
MKLLHNEVEVSEYIQMLFIYIWDKRMSISVPDNATAYLLASLRRMIFRKLGRKRVLHLIDKDVAELDEGFQLVPDKMDMMAEDESRKELNNKITAALQKLTAREREVVYLRYNKNMALEDVAETMGIRQQSVSNLTASAMKKLKRILG